LDDTFLSKLVTGFIRRFREAIRVKEKQVSRQEGCLLDDAVPLPKKSQYGGGGVKPFH
jgi:hypothetical protein